MPSNIEGKNRAKLTDQCTFNFGFSTIIELQSSSTVARHSIGIVSRSSTTAEYSRNRNWSGRAARSA